MCDVFLCDILFFKQKTAYEMRISDWSSDVCSSDLLDLKMPVVDPVKCVARIASKSGLSEKTKRKALEILKKAEQGKISAGKDQNGRESCRERECKYV